MNLQEGDILSQAVDDVPQLPGDGAVFFGVVHACVNRNSLNLATSPYDMFFSGGVIKIQPGVDRSPNILDILGPQNPWEK